MALTAAERQRKRREKLKREGKYDEHMKINRKHQEKSRIKKKAQENLLPMTQRRRLMAERRLKTYERVKKFRALKKARKNSPKISPFKSAAALAKAIHRARRGLQSNLPKTPRRKRVVCRNIFKTTPQKVPTTELSSRGLDKSVVSLVEKFFEREDVSRQAPGRKDVITVKRDFREKEKVQVRHLTCSLMEVYAFFKEEYPEVNIGKSKFASLRPRHVLLQNKLPHNVCLCRQHENFINAINSLHKVCPEVPLYTREFPEKIICPTSSDDCWLNKCGYCQDGKGFKGTFSIEDAESTVASWHVWKNDSDNNLNKCLEEGTINDLYEYVVSLIPPFLGHCFVKRRQSSSYNEERELANSVQSFALLQVDFSENYTCQQQDEIQSAHWHQSQVTLFTATLWNRGKLHSTVIVSNNLHHGKETLLSYVDKLLESLPAGVKIVSVWSDGPASQFKNRYVAASLAKFENKHGITIRWNFFATSHGKGPVDGVGGAVKRFVWTAAKNRKFVVINAESFAKAAQAMSKVVVLHVEDRETEERNESLGLKEIFTNAPSIPGIHNVHHIFVQNGSPLTYHTTGLNKNKITASEETVAENCIKVGDWCLVEYDNLLYPGEIKLIADDAYEVSVMVKAGPNHWKWPAFEDKIFYTHEKIKKLLKPPTVINARDHYLFEEVL